MSSLPGNSLATRPLRDCVARAQASVLDLLARRGIGPLPDCDADVVEIAAEIPDGSLGEFLDRLERLRVLTTTSSDTSIWFLPVRFTESFETGMSLSCASLYELRSAVHRLESELELDIAPDARNRRLAKQRNLWRAFRRGARQALRDGSVLELVRT